jgi:hypothetical protein
MSQNLLLEDLIQKALSKVNGKKERDLCRFLPCSRGYMHHFTFRKMMQESPQQLFDLIQEYIIEPEKPQEIQLKPIEQSYQTNKNQKAIKLFKKNQGLLRTAEAIRLGIHPCTIDQQLFLLIFS